MQKVEGSNPFIRSIEAPLRRGFSLRDSDRSGVDARFWKRFGNDALDRDGRLMQGHSRRRTSGSRARKRDCGSRAQVKDALPIGYRVRPATAVPHFTGHIIRRVEKRSHLHAAKSPDGEQG